jgi:hypothetical protein
LRLDIHPLTNGRVPVQVVVAATAVQYEAESFQ